MILPIVVGQMGERPFARQNTSRNNFSLSFPNLGYFSLSSRMYSTTATGVCICRGWTGRVVLGRRADNRFWQSSYRFFHRYTVGLETWGKAWCTAFQPTVYNNRRIWNLNLALSEVSKPRAFLSVVIRARYCPLVYLGRIYIFLWKSAGIYLTDCLI